MPEETPNSEIQKSNNNETEVPISQPGSVTEPTSSGQPAEVPADTESTSKTPTASFGDASPATDNADATKPSLAIPADTPVKKTGKTKGILTAVLALILIAGGAAGAWFLTQDKTESDKSANNSVIAEIDTLTIGNTEGPANTFFPDEQLQGIYFGLNRQIYEGLVGFEDKKITPLLAKSWTNPDEKTWIFTLKPGIKFHTGKTLTAGEVKASLEDLKKYEYWSIFVSTIETIEVVSDDQVKIITTEPDALLLNRLSLAFITDLSATDAAGRNGTGAYMVDTSATNDEYNTTLVAFDEYHGDRAKTRKLIYKIYENDEAVVKALKEGTIDIAETLNIPATKAKMTSEGYATTEFDSPGAFGMYLNHNRKTHSLFNKKEFRLAIAQAIDRQALVEEVNQNHTPSTQVIPKSLPGYDASIKMPDFSVEDAKQSLAAAGYKNEPLEFVYIEGIQADAPVLIGQLRAAGFNIREKKYEEGTIPNMVSELRAGRFDIFTAGYSSDFVDARDLLGALLHSTESTYPILEDEAYDEILLESDKAFDPADRTKKLQEANRYIADNLLWIPLRNSVYLAYYKPDLNITLDFYGGGNLGAYYRKVGRTVN